MLISFFDIFFVSKQNSPRWDAAFYDVTSGSMSNKKHARRIWVKYFNENPAYVTMHVL